MADPKSEMTYWQSIAAAADAEQLYLNPEAAAACSQACDDYIQKLRLHQDSAKLLVNVTGWGDFDSGKQLQKIFADKAAGGPNNMVDILQAHIDVVEEMKMVFNKFFVATNETDAASASDVQAQGPN